MSRRPSRSKSPVRPAAWTIACYPPRGMLQSSWQSTRWLWGHGLPEPMWRHEFARVMGSRWNGSNLMLKVAFGRGASCTPLPALPAPAEPRWGRGHRGGATFLFRASRLHRLWNRLWMSTTSEGRVVPKAMRNCCGACVRCGARGTPKAPLLCIFLFLEST